MKACRICGETKALSEFYKHSQMADGHLHKCKACTRKEFATYSKTPAGKRAKSRERIKHADKYRAWKRVWKKTAKGKLAVKRYQRSEERRQAKDAVNNAIKAKRLRALPCFICGGKAEAHHCSYAPDMRLAVTWLCQPHHNQLHQEFARTS